MNNMNHGNAPTRHVIVKHEVFRRTPPAVQLNKYAVWSTGWIVNSIIALREARDAQLLIPN